MQKKEEIIVILIGSLETGGAQRMAIRLFQALRDKDINCYLATIDGNMDMLSTTRKVITNNRLIKISKVDVSWPTWKKLLYTPIQWLQIQRVLKKIKPTIILSFMERANLHNLICTWHAKKILSIRSHPDLLQSKDYSKQLAIKIIYKLFLRNASQIIFNAKEAEASFKNKFLASRQTPTTTIYNFLATTERNYPYVSTARNNKTLIIQTIGRLTKEKGHWQLLRAFAPLTEKYNNIRLQIAGDGFLRKQLEKLARDLGVDNQVTFQGFVEKTQDCLAKSDIFILPSVWEGFPNALLEAMSTGCPVIATDCSSGPREILAPTSNFNNKTTTVEITEHGILTPPISLQQQAAPQLLTHSEKCLSEAMETLINDQNLRESLAESALQRARYFSEKNLIEQWIQVFERSNKISD